jgi:hypothetical protein
MSFGRRVACVIALAVVQTLGYWTVNHRVSTSSSTLPLTALEASIPFVPLTVWPYLAMLASELVLPLFVRKRGEFLRLLVGYAIAMTIAFTIYAVWPTHYPRPPQPLDDTVSAWAYRWLVTLDTPECCLPSGHVIVPALASWSAYRDRRRIWPIMLVLVLTPSVLTTKQHYIADVVAGLALAASAICIARRLVPEKHTASARTL